MTGLTSVISYWGRTMDTLNPNETVITSANAIHFINPLIDGETKKCGTIPRDWGVQHQHVRPMGAVDVPLIPEAEWKDRVLEKVAAKSQLSDVWKRQGPNGGKIPSLDQNGKGYCVTADTEVLTARGWVAYPDYNWSEPIGTVNPVTHALEFQTPFERHVYEYDGPMVYSTNRRIDFGVTPDHQMYVRKWDEQRRALSDRYSFVRAGDIGWYAGLLHAPAGQIGTELVEVEVPGDLRYDGDDFLAMLGLIVSDGYAGGSESTRNWVSFASFRDGSWDAVSALAARVGFHESPSRRGVWVRYDAGALAAWVRENCYAGGVTGAASKRVPPLVKWASVRQIRHFLHWFDDRNRDGSQFYSASKGLIDDLQELHLRIGKRSTIHYRPAKDVPYNGKTIHSGESIVLTVGDADRLSIDRKKHIETDRYKGLVYCAAVPNHTLLTRRNGSVLISSNCWAHSGTSAVTALRAAANQPYVGLSAYAVACIIKQYKDEGGWGAQGLDFLSERGVPSEAFWPMQSMSRSNDKPETWANAAIHKVTEGWIDLAKAQYDRTLTREQVASCLLMNVPVIVDYNWWGHSVCALDLVILPNGRFGVRIQNSWGDSWSDGGMGVLDESKAWPDGATAPLTAGASTN